MYGRRFLGAVLSALLMTSGAAAATIPILESDHLVVQLDLKPVATLADLDWIALEFVNTGKTACTLDTVNCTITGARTDRHSRRFRGTDTLACMNLAGLLPEHWQEGDHSPTIEPGRKLRVEAPLTESFRAALRIAPQSGWTVNATITMSVRCAEHGWMHTPADGAGFMFSWMRPSTEDLEGLRAELLHRLTTPTPTDSYSPLVQAFLEMPTIRGPLKPMHLLAGLVQRSEDGAVRDAIMRQLALFHQDDPVVIEAFQKMLVSGEWMPLLDVQEHGLWSETFVAPLVQVCETQPAQRRLALEILNEHRTVWANDLAIIDRLAARVLADCHLLHEPVTSLDEDQLRQWTGQVAELALTGYRPALHLLVPALGDERIFMTAYDVPAGERMPPLRVCDHAMEAILTLTEGGIDDAYDRSEFDSVMTRRGATHDLDELAFKLRDDMIESLRLDASITSDAVTQVIDDAP